MAKTVAKGRPFRIFDRSAFFVAACMSIAVVRLAAFVRTPKQVEAVEGMPAH